MRLLGFLPAFLLGAFLGLSTLALNAQEHGSAPAKQEHTATPQPAEHGTAEAKHASATGHDAGHGGAAHHGPEVKLPFMQRALTSKEQFALKAFNFLVFALLLILPLKGALSAAFKARAQELEERLSLAEKEKAEGEAQVRELEARMAGLEGELDSILAKADADANAEKERVLEAARAEAEAILAQARTEIDIQRRLAEQELRALVAELAVEGAAQRIRTRMEGSAAAVVTDRAIEHISQRAATEGIQ
jgi:F-type H+-transporting ATPase subunit b